MAQANGVIRDAKQLMGKALDFGGLPLDDDEGVIPQFYLDAIEDPLLTAGGTIPKNHHRVAGIRATLKDLGTELAEDPSDATMYVVPPAGRPIHVEAEMLRIIVPGDKDNIVDRPVREEDKRRFSTAYRKWKESNHSETAMGTPLNMLPGITNAQAKDLAYFEIRTVEQFASVSDTNLSNIGPYSVLRQRARDWLAAAKGAAPIEAARAENERLRNEVETLKKQQAEILAEMRKTKKSP